MLGVHKNTQSCKNRENKIRQELAENGIPNHKRSKTAIEKETPNAVACDLNTHCFKLLLSEVFLKTNKVFNLVWVVVAVAFNVVVKASATLDGKSVCADRNALSFWKSIKTYGDFMVCKIDKVKPSMADYVRRLHFLTYVNRCDIFFFICCLCILGGNNKSKAAKQGYNNHDYSNNFFSCPHFTISS